MIVLTVCCQRCYGRTVVKTLSVYATDTMADWEYAYLTAEVARAEMTKPGRFALVWVGDGTTPVTSMGGLTVCPDKDLGALEDDDNLAALVIPGSDSYDAGHERLLTLVDKLLDRKVPVAAICGGTALLARAGYLDARRHTSNALAYLEMTGYAGRDFYDTVPVAHDAGIVTGSGVRPVEFTAEVMRRVGLYPPELIDEWEAVYTGQGAEHFYALMEYTDAWKNA